MKIALIAIAILLALAVIGMLVFVFVIQNVETPDYQVVAQDGDFELRDYPALVVAEITRSGDRQQSLSKGFGPLARYIFAKERAGERIAMTAPVQQSALGADEKIAMTAPVTQTVNKDNGEGDNDQWTVQFIMPAEYPLASLPAPGNDAVELREVPARRLAAVRFSGRTNDQAIAKQEKRLRDWLDTRGLTPIGAPVYAYYNDPFTPGPLRRNEVLLEVAKAGP
jgi:DNA gyrase inhibitor GyrI